MQGQLNRIENWTMLSQTGDHPYEVFIAKPKQPPPPSGYPVLYVLDGNAFFQTFQETIRIQSIRSEKTGVAPAIVVGIGYPGEADFVSECRVLDFTPPSSALDLPDRPDGKSWPKSGGAEKFLQFIEQELKPKVNETYEADPARHIFFGHSLGGLFGLYALFTKPEAFYSYMISSPSIWWNQQCILELESEFIDRLKDGNLKIYLSAGAQEKQFMVEDVKELAERLTRLEDSRLDIMLDIAEGENHISVVPAALSRSLRFLLKP